MSCLTEVGIGREGEGAVVVVDEFAIGGLKRVCIEEDGFALDICEVGDQVAGVDGVVGVFQASG